MFELKEVKIVVMKKFALAKTWPVEFRKRLESSCIIISNLTLPKSEHQNRREKINQK